MDCSDPEKFKGIKGRLKEYRNSHPAVFSPKSASEERVARRVGGVIVREFRWLADEHKRLVAGTGVETNAKRAEAARERLDQILDAHGDLVASSGFIKAIDGLAFQDMDWLAKDIDRVLKTQPVEAGAE